jgi:hypothetical protein
MVVMLMIIVMLVIGLVVAETNLAGEPRFGQQFQRTIDSRVPDARILFLHQPIKILAG